MIAALDVPTPDEALALAEELFQYGVSFFKIGLELIMGGSWTDIAAPIRGWGGLVFGDGKIHDIPNTAMGAVANMFWHTDMLNVHISGGRKMMTAALEKAQAVADSGGSFACRPAVIGVTLLTSLGFNDLQEIGDVDYGQGEFGVEEQANVIEGLVVRRALLAKEVGLDGVVASSLEAMAIRRHCGSDFLITTPAIRFSDNSADDQRRLATPAFAVAAGANFLVFGRALTQAADKEAAVARAIREIEEGMAEAA